MKPYPATACKRHTNQGREGKQEKTSAKKLLSGFFVSLKIKLLPVGYKANCLVRINQNY
jgi:hypothetical protein